jgi:hypothetical protein
MSRALGGEKLALEGTVLEGGEEDCALMLSRRHLSA